jgi:chorismate mutase
VVCTVVALLSALCAPGRASADSSDPLTELVDAAARRLQVAEPVAAAKWHSGAAVADPDRVRQQLDALADDAAAAQIDAGYVRQVFGDQIDATEAIEYTRFAQWKLDPAAAPPVAPALADSRAAIDEFNHVMLTQIAAQWEVLHSPDCGDRLDSARTAVARSRRLDTLYRQALAAASRSYCPPPPPQ